MEFVNYLKDHPDLIASVICVVLSLIVLIIKRRPKTLDEFVAILSDVCNGVAEKMESVEVAGHGVEKREKVIALCTQEMIQRMKRQLSVQEDAVVRLRVSEQIEKVMDAPHRKEI